MKALVVSALLVCSTLSGNAFAACSGNSLNQTQLRDLLSGKTVCATLGNDKWQEEHRVGGDLWDYKLGPSSTMDPSEKVGTWSVTGSGSNAQVVHTYTSAGAYSYKVYDNGNGTYDFCGSSTVSNATVRAAGPC